MQLIDRVRHRRAGRAAVLCAIDALHTGSRRVARRLGLGTTGAETHFLPGSLSEIKEPRNPIRFCELLLWLAVTVACTVVSPLTHLRCLFTPLYSCMYMQYMYLLLLRVRLQSALH